MDTMPKEMVNDAIDRAAMLHLMKSITYDKYFERRIERILHYGFARSRASSRLYFSSSAPRQRSPARPRNSAALVSLKSSGCALASSSQVRGMDTGAPGAPRGEYATFSVLPRTFML